jgi:hypothetical protein
MRKYIFVIIVFINTLNLFTQNQLTEYGKVGKEVIEYNSCEFDKTADAVVMFDNGKSRFIDADREGFKIVYERITRIKILTDAGIKWGNVEIPYYYSENIYEDVYDIEASTYNFENGQLAINKLNSNDCHIEKVNENWMLKKFALPNVKKGTIIEYRYKIETPYVFNLRNWEFQWKIPVLNSQYIVELIPFYEYQFKLQGANSFNNQTSVEGDFERQFGSVKFRDMIHTYFMKNIQAFVDEEFITSKNDYIIKLDFQLSKIIYPDGYKKDIITTWDKLSEDLLTEDNFGKYVNKAKKILPKILNPTGFVNMSSKEKYDSVLNFVKHNFTWDKKERKYASKTPSELLKDKFGNSSDINLLTIGLLNGLGIEAYPVLISTREHGKIKLDYPYHDFFNYTLIGSKIDSSFTLSDATDILLANNRIPLSCINDKGLIIQKKKIEWISLQPQQATKLKTSIIVNFSDTLNNTQLIVNSTEYNGLNFRKKYGDNIKEIQKKLSENNYQVEDSNVVVKNNADISNPYIINLKFNFLPEKINNKIYVTPFLNEVTKNNPLKQKERLYPIDMIYPEYKLYNSTIKIPTGYKIYSLPENQKVKNDNFELNYYSTTTNDFVNISFSYFFRKSEYPSSEYLNLKFYFNEIIKRGSEKVVFIKD